MQQREDLQSLVVIGSSAGGIEALSKLVLSLPVDFPAPIILAQHLHPERSSRLTEILRARSKLPIQTVESQHDLVDGTIYLVVPNTHIAISGHDVQVVEDGGRPKPSIDLLFETASEVFQENLVAVILSGMGSDGTAGVRAVKERNGVVIIENPKTSAFPAMALSVPPTLVDFVVDMDAIGPLLYDLLSGAYDVDSRTGEDGFRHLLANVQARTGIDFSSYKTPTIARRIQRRMVATDSQDLDQYLEYLDGYPEEYDTLANSFLIKVTEFFRDRELFEYLLSNGFEPLIELAAESNELRIWSAGCATGEEAYSLAIVAQEVIGDRHPDIRVRIFATDIDADAIAYARRGIYPASAVKNLPPELLERYFDDLGEFYEVRKSLRSMVIFGEHDLGQRSPFPRIHMVVCRNVLIYFGTQLQRRALQLFAFALVDGGLLVLGKAETITPLPEFFDIRESRLKVFRRQGNHVIIPPGHTHETPPPRPNPRLLEQAERAYSPPVSDLEPTSRRRLGIHSERTLRTTTTGTVIINRSYRILYINPAARRHLGIHGIAIDEDLIHVVQYVPLTELRNSIEQALQGQSESRVFEIEAAGGEVEARQFIEFACLPIADEVSGSDILVQTLDVTDTHQTREKLRDTSERLQRQVSSFQNLEATNRRLTDINTRLHANNEELLISNEEFQAAAEEVETLNEELQATNEELETLNEELQATIEELNTTNEDLQIRSREMELLAAEREARRHESEARQSQLQATLASLEDAVMLVDPESSMVVTNPTFDAWFEDDGMNLVPHDLEGNRLPEAEWPQRRAANGDSFIQRFSVLHESGERLEFEAKGQPIKGDGSQVGGVVVIRRIEAG